MSLKFGISLPQGWTMELANVKDPVEAYETMTQVAQFADEVGFESLWLVDHFHTIPPPRPLRAIPAVSALARWSPAMAIAIPRSLLKWPVQSMSSRTDD